MIGITIDSVELSALTGNGEFGVQIPFEKGLNVIRASNSRGKSTVVNGIAYGLGLESMLGPSRKNSFAKSLYEVIFDHPDDKNPSFVKSSFVVLRLTNSKEQSAQVTRDILGDTSKVNVEFEGENLDYFLRGNTHVGSAKSEKGFHYWLADFIGWKLPTVAGYDGQEKLLYLECIFPLFFIEQKRGWSEIQANIPTIYGIKNVKKLAAEYCLGIEEFEYEKQEAKLLSSIEMSKSEWGKLVSNAEGVADFNSVLLNDIGDIEDKSDLFEIDFHYLENQTTLSIEDHRVALERLLQDYQEKVSEFTPSNDALDSQISLVRSIRSNLEKVSNDIDINLVSTSDIKRKLSVLNRDFSQYQQLKRLKTVGGDIDGLLDSDKCPICDSDLNDSLDTESSNRNPMTLEENIDFLKNQLAFFGSIKERNSLNLKNLLSNKKLLESKIEYESDVLSKLKIDIDDANGELNSIIRTKLKAEMKLAGVLRLIETKEDLNKQAERIYSGWELHTNSLKKLRLKKKESRNLVLLKELEVVMKQNLQSFGFNYADLSSVSISHQTLRPEQEGYDIVAETSASDYIRIIWAYTLALLELAGGNEKMKHGGFVVLDEPRQHEAKEDSYKELLNKASESIKYGGQVIIATSFSEEKLQEMCDDEKVNLNCFGKNDFILRLKPKPVLIDSEVDDKEADE